MISPDQFQVGQAATAVGAGALCRRTTEHGCDRARAALRHNSLAAALLFDSLNIRYVTGSSLMPVWTLHVLDRCPFEGKPVLWEYPAATAGPEPQIGHAVTTMRLRRRRS